MNAKKSMTLREIAEATGAAYRTVAAYAQKAGLTRNGETTYLDEKQSTIIIEAIRQGADRNHSNTLLSTMQGVETTHSRALRIDVLHKQLEAELEAEIGELQERLALDAPKARAWEQMLDAEGYLDFQETAAVLNIHGLGRNNLYSFLRDKGVLTSRNIPYRNYIEQGYFRVIETTGRDREGNEHINYKTFVHQKGIDFILRLWFFKKDTRLLEQEGVN